MKKNIIFYFISLIGVASVFLPYYESIYFACGFGINHQGFEYVTFFQMYIESIEFFRPKLLTFIEVIWQTLVLISIVFSVIFFFYKKYIVLIYLNIISIIYFALNLFSAFDMLIYGFYILFFQQILLIIIVIKTKIDVAKIVIK
ncbi:MAG: hypothetical protein V4548_06430 [Bacteroidota bacterium]